MDIRQLQTFQTLARTLNFTQAAERLDYAQSSVTAQIQTLERELGVKLFERLGKRIALTASGERLLEYANKILQLADEAQMAVAHHDQPVGRLNISAPETLSAYRLPPLLRAFRTRYPAVQLILQSIADGEIFDALTNGKVDVGITLSEPRRVPQELRAVRLTQESLLLLAYPEHPLTGFARIESDDLRHETMLLTEARCTYRVLFESRLAAAGVRLSTTMEFSSIEAIKQCVMAGVGLTLLPQLAVINEMQQGRLVALDWKHTDDESRDLSLDMHVVWHKDKTLVPALLEFIKLTGEIFCDAPLEIEG